MSTTNSKTSNANHQIPKATHTMSNNHFENTIKMKHQAIKQLHKHSTSNQYQVQNLHATC